MLPLQHVRERLQRPLVGAGDGAAAAAIVEQGVDRFLQHALFVAHDDIGRAQFDQPLQPVVAVDDAAVEIVEVGCRKAAAVQRHQRAQFRRDDRHDGQDHPLRAVAGFEEAFHNLQPLDDLLRLQFRLGGRKLFQQRHFFSGQIKLFQQLADGFRADSGLEGFLAMLVLCFQIFVFGQQLELLQRGHARLDDDVLLEIENALQILQRHVEEHADAAGERLQEPDVGNGCCQLDVAHPLAAHLGYGDFNAALFADDALVLHPLVLAAQALIILDRPEDAGAEQAITLRLEGPVVDGFRLLDFAEGPAANALGRGNRNLDAVKNLRLGDRGEGVGDQFVHKNSSRP